MFCFLPISPDCYICVFQMSPQDLENPVNISDGLGKTVKVQLPILLIFLSSFKLSNQLL